MSDKMAAACQFALVDTLLWSCITGFFPNFIYGQVTSDIRYIRTYVCKPFKSRWDLKSDLKPYLSSTHIMQSVWKTWIVYIKHAKKDCVTNHDARLKVFWFLLLIKNHTSDPKHLLSTKYHRQSWCQIWWPSIWYHRKISLRQQS